VPGSCPSGKKRYLNVQWSRGDRGVGRQKRLSFESPAEWMTHRSMNGPTWYVFVQKKSLKRRKEIAKGRDRVITQEEQGQLTVAHF